MIRLTRMIGIRRQKIFASVARPTVAGKLVSRVPLIVVSIDITDRIGVICYQLIIYTFCSTLRMVIASGHSLTLRTPQRRLLRRRCGLQRKDSGDNRRRKRYRACNGSSGSEPRRERDRAGP